MYVQVSPHYTETELTTPKGFLDPQEVTNNHGLEEGFQNLAALQYHLGSFLKIYSQYYHRFPEVRVYHPWS